MQQKVWARLNQNEGVLVRICKMIAVSCFFPEYSCFTHFSKIASTTPDFIEINLERGCPVVTFAHVFKKKEEFIRQCFGSDYIEIIRKV